MPERQRRWADWVTAIATVMICITTGVYTYYAKKQWREMQGSGKQTNQLIYLYRQQLAELQKQASDTHDLAAAARIQATQTKLLAERALDQAKSTKRLAEQAKVSADISRDALTKSSRPWIGVDGPLIGAAVVADPVEISHPMLSAGRPPQTQIKTRIILTVKNFGKDPAFFVTSDGMGVANQVETNPSKFFDREKWGFRISCEMADRMRDFPIVPGEKGSGPTMFPNDTLPVGVGYNLTSPTFRLDLPLEVVGCISYRDQFFASHHTKFCFASNVPITSVIQGQQLIRCNYAGAD